jgi:hypothetical protein
MLSFWSSLKADFIVVKYDDEYPLEQHFALPLVFYRTEANLTL